MARVLSLLAVFGAAVLVFGSAPAPAGALPLGGLGFKPLSPVRLLDTRAGYQTVDTLEAGGGALGQGESRVVRVGGRGGVPASGVAAVVLNLTAAEATAATFLTAYAAGGARPEASTLNPVPGAVSSNVAVVPVSAAGEIAVFNYVGRVEVIADVEGWFPVGGVFRPVAPARLTDTRPGYSTVDGRDAGGGPLGAGVTHDVQVAGRAGVPTVGVGAVVVNVTAVNVSAATYVTAFPAGTARPVASMSNPVPGGPTPAMAVVALSA